MLAPHLRWNMNAGGNGSTFLVRGNLKDASCQGTNDQITNGCISLPVGRIAPPASCWRPDLLNVNGAEEALLWDTVDCDILQTKYRYNLLRIDDMIRYAGRTLPHMTPKEWMGWTVGMLSLIEANSTGAGRYNRWKHNFLLYLHSTAANLYAYLRNIPPASATHSVSWLCCLGSDRQGRNWLRRSSLIVCCLLPLSAVAHHRHRHCRCPLSQVKKKGSRFEILRNPGANDLVFTIIKKWQKCWRVHGPNVDLNDPPHRDSM